MNLHCPDIGVRSTVDPDGAAVTGDSYELLRCMFSRRTRAQADTTLDWGSADSLSRDLFAVYDWPAR